jgi:hypothetical protein
VHVHYADEEQHIRDFVLFDPQDVPVIGGVEFSVHELLADPEE